MKILGSTGGGDYLDRIFEVKEYIGFWYKKTIVSFAMKILKSFIYSFLIILYNIHLASPLWIQKFQSTSFSVDFLSFSKFNYFIA